MWYIIAFISGTICGIIITSIMVVGKDYPEQIDDIPTLDRQNKP